MCQRLNRKKFIHTEILKCCEAHSLREKNSLITSFYLMQAIVAEGIPFQK